MSHPVLGRIIGVSVDNGDLNRDKKGLTRILIGLGEAQGVKNGMSGTIVETGLEFVLDRLHPGGAFSAVLGTKDKRVPVDSARSYDAKTDRHYGYSVLIVGFK